MLKIITFMQYLKEDLSQIGESWAAARFDSLPHVVHILTSKDRETDLQALKERNDVIEDVVNEVVHAYHSGVNRAIQNYSQVSSTSTSILLHNLMLFCNRVGFACALVQVLYAADHWKIPP